LVIALVLAIINLVHSEQSSRPQPATEASTEALPAPASTYFSTELEPDPPVASSSGFILTPQIENAELDVIRSAIQGGGHMDTSATVYRGTGLVVGVLCRDGYFDANYAMSWT